MKKLVSENPRLEAPKNKSANNQYNISMPNMIRAINM